MKKTFMAALAAFVSIQSIAQATIGEAAFGKMNESAVLLNVPYQQDAATTGVQNYLYKYSKPKQAKGYYLYRGVRAPGLSDSAVTIYISIEKKDKHSSNITLLLSNEFDRFYNAKENAGLFANAIQFVNGLQAPIQAADLEMRIATQQKIFDKQDKRIKKLKEEASDLEKQQKKLQEKMATNSADLEKEQAGLAKEKEALDILIKQRVN